jgi:polysaccharide export outer membrane protein
MRLFIVFGSSWLIILTSCSLRRNLVYFSDLSSQGAESHSINAVAEPKIQPNDVLSITISTPSPESNLLFSVSSTSMNKNGYFEKEGYRVDQQGDVILPIVGRVPLKDLTIPQAQEFLVKTLTTYVKNPIANIQFLNFRITVIGEVNHPSTFNITNEQVNLLEALGMAGDLTVYGKRENILLIREMEGKRSMVRMNLNNRDVLNSPFFYLKQNDVIYVEPDKAKSLDYSPNNRLMPLIVASISAVAVLATTLLSR